MAWNLSAEVAAVGFAGVLLWRALRMLGIKDQARKWLVANITQQEEAASRWIWVKRNKWWQSKPVVFGKEWDEEMMPLIQVCAGQSTCKVDPVAMTFVFCI